MKLKREFIKTDKLKMPGFKCQNKFYAPVSVMQIGPRVGYRVEFITCYVFFNHLTELRQNRLFRE